MINAKLLFPIVALGFSCILAGVATEANAGLYTVQASIEFSGAAAPVGTPPWLTATFDDHSSSGLVTMTLAATNLTGSEFVSEWYLNLDPALDPTDLIFSAPTKTGVFTTPSISLHTDHFKADGDGKYDILLGFATSGGGSPSPTRFDSADAVTYTITGISSLTASSFDFLSQPAGGHGPFAMAAHVQGVGPDGALSGWVAPGGGFTIPEPATIGFLALGGLTAMRRR